MVLSDGSRGRAAVPAGISTGSSEVEQLQGGMWLRLWGRGVWGVVSHLSSEFLLTFAVELTPEAMGSPEEEGVFTMDITMSLLAYNYNQPVSIVLPPEAEEAVEMPQE